MSKHPFPYTLEINEDTFILKTFSKRTRGWYHLFLVFVGTITFLVPIPILFIIILTFEIKFLAFLVCLFILFWGVSLKCLLLFLWNRRGIEVFTIQSGIFEVYDDYHYFKDKRKRATIEHIEVYYASGIDYYDDEEAEALGIHSSIADVEGNYPIRFFINDDDIIDSARAIPIEVIREIRTKCNTAAIL